MPHRISFFFCSEAEDDEELFSPHDGDDELDDEDDMERARSVLSMMSGKTALTRDMLKTPSLASTRGDDGDGTRSVRSGRSRRSHASSFSRSSSQQSKRGFKKSAGMMGNDLFENGSDEDVDEGTEEFATEAQRENRRLRKEREQIARDEEASRVNKILETEAKRSKLRDAKIEKIFTFQKSRRECKDDNGLSGFQGEPNDLENEAGNAYGNPDDEGSNGKTSMLVEAGLQLLTEKKPSVTLPSSSAIGQGLGSLSSSLKPASLQPQSLPRGTTMNRALLTQGLGE